MSSTPSVAVLVSAGRHPVSGAPRACPGDAIAMALAARLAGASLRVIHAGRAGDAALADYLALGAARIEVLARPEAEDPLPLLARHLANVDVIVTGMQTETCAGSGILPYSLAHVLGRPIVTNALEIKRDGAGLDIVQFMPRGMRRRIAAPWPVVIGVHPLSAVELRYAHARKASGRIEAMAVALPEASPGTNSALAVPAWRIEPATGPLVRLKAKDTAPAHSRMMAAIGSESKAGVVVFEGTAVDKAQVMLNYLREHRLVDF